MQQAFAAAWQASSNRFNIANLCARPIKHDAIMFLSNRSATSFGINQAPLSLCGITDFRCASHSRRSSSVSVTVGTRRIGESLFLRPKGHHIFASQDEVTCAKLQRATQLAYRFSTLLIGTDSKALKAQSVLLSVIKSLARKEPARKL